MPFKTVLVKGLGKIKFPSHMSDDAIEKSIKSLDMSEAARMARAKEQGFDKNLFHASDEVFSTSPNVKDAIDDNITVRGELKPKYGGIYLSDDYDLTESIFARGPFGNVSNLKVNTGKNFNANYRSMSESQKDELKDVMDSLVDEEKIREVAEEMGYTMEEAHPFEVMTDGDLFQVYGRDFQNEVMEELRKRGYDSVTFPDNLAMGDMTQSTVVFDPKRIRGQGAAFNPDAKDSPSLLASSAPLALGSGLAALSMSDDSTANPLTQSVTGTIKAPKHPNIAKVSEFIDKHDDILMDDLLGGVTSYLDKLAYEDKITFKDRIIAALDLI